MGTEAPKQAQPPTSVSDELEALNALMRLLEPMDKAARTRIVTYAVARLDVYLPRD